MTKFLLVAIILLALTLRVWNLSAAPAGLYWDEMDVGYQAYSLLKTGKDYFGDSDLLVVHSFADFRAPLFIYSAIPFVAVLGLTPLSVRLPAAVFGALSVFLIYILTLKMFKNPKAALMAAFLACFAPWNIQYSRMAFEATLMLTLFLGGLTAFIEGLNKPKWFLLSGTLFGLSLFVYNTSKLFVPLFVLLLAVIYIRKKELTRPFYISIIILASALLISLYSTFFLNGGQRFSQISVLTDPQITSQVDVLRHDSGVAFSDKVETGRQARLADKLIYNKVTFIADLITQNYLQAFSSDFLFLKGDPNLRHSTSAAGEFYAVESISIFIGFLTLFLGIRKKDKNSLLIALWIIVAPLPAVITRDGGTHATRLFLLFPALTITSALGVSYLFNAKPKKFILPGILALMGAWLFGMFFFLNFYFGSYQLINPRQFQYGFDQAVIKALENKNSYDYVIIDDRRDSALMNYLFLTQYDPNLLQSRINTLGVDFLGGSADKFDNIIITKPGEMNWPNIFKKNLLNNKYLLVVSSLQFSEESVEKVPDKLTPDQKLLDVIYYKSGAPAFYVIESQKPKINDHL